MDPLPFPLLVEPGRSFTLYLKGKYIVKIIPAKKKLHRFAYYILTCSYFEVSVFFCCLFFFFYDLSRAKGFNYI